MTAYRCGLDQAPVAKAHQIALVQFKPHIGKETFEFYTIEGAFGLSTPLGERLVTNLRWLIFTNPANQKLVSRLSIVADIDGIGLAHVRSIRNKI